MPYELSAGGLNNPSQTVGQVVHHLARLVVGKMDRNAFFRMLAKQLSILFHYDRFCINLYDAEREFLNLFTAADGTVVESLSNTRIAQNTVAGLAIASRKPVVINDLTKHDFGDSPMPLSTVGLNSTIALPLIVNSEVIGTLHVSFMQPPENIVQILNVLLELSPVLSTFLFAVLSEERLEKVRAAQAGSARSPEADPTGSILLAASLLETPDMKKLMALARKVAKLHIPVMILGETGTGKSMLARWLHLHSPRRKNSFVKVNCPSLPPTLFESEMFGYAKGAFTGATSKRVGRVELAQGGTLFLDEIGELAPEMQSKLLQVLEENSFERVGEAAPIGVDMRVMSATNIDMAAAMNQGRLRRDLYYRLGSVVLRMPPLRERKNDIPLFVEHFVRQFSREYEIHPPRLSRPVMDALQEHVWPGNIRELRNVVSRLLLQTLDGQITGSFVDEALHLWKGPAGTAPSAPVASAPGLVARNAGDSPSVPVSARQEASPALLSLEENERAHIAKALRLCGGKLSGPGGAADVLGVPRSTLQYRIRKLGISQVE